MAKIILIHPDELPKSYYQVIGEITYKWSLVELLLHDIARYYLEFNKRAGRVAFFNMGFTAKISTIKAVAHGWVKDQGLATEITEIAKEAGKVYKDRNKVVHGVWGYETGKSKRKLYLMYVNEYKDKIYPKAKHTTAKTLAPITKRIDKLLRQIRKFYLDAGLPEP